MWLFLVIACGLNTSSVSVVSEPDRPPDVVVDSGGSGEGDLAVTLLFSRVEGAVGCAAAGVSALSLTFAGAEIVLPCDDSGLEWLGVPAAEDVLSVRGDTSYGPFYEGSALIEVIDGEVSAVNLTLLCDDNGLDDGCGGA